MGSYVSKFLARYGEETTEPKNETPYMDEFPPCTPTDVKRTLTIDPRSASVGIPRTPIQVNYTPPNASRRVITAIPSYLQKKPYLETDFDNISLLAPKKASVPRETASDVTSLSNLHKATNTQDTPVVTVRHCSPITLPKHEDGDTPIAELRYKILGIDPRSPALDFDRTPILTPKSLKRLKARSHENLCRRDSYFELCIPYQQRLSYCETTAESSIPEVLALPDIVSNLNKATNLNSTMEDSNQFGSCNSTSGSSVETISESGEQITVIRNPNIQSMPEDYATSSIGSSIERIEDPHGSPRPGGWDNVNRVLSIATNAHNQQQQITSDPDKKIKVWRDSVSSENSDTRNLDTSKNFEVAQSNANIIPKQEVMIDFDDDIQILKIVKLKPLKKVEVPNAAKKKKQDLVEKKNRNSETDHKILQEKVFASEEKNTNINQLPKVRTPLGNRSNNHGKLSDMPMKSPQQLLRGKVMSTKLQQENTPPRSVKSKLNSTQWDPDTTVLI